VTRPEFLVDRFSADRRPVVRGPIVAACGPCYAQPNMRRNLWAGCIAGMVLLCAMLLAQETVDLSVVQRIRTEAIDNS
jgi:hypothetical protein